MSLEHIPTKTEVAPLGKRQPNPKGRLQDQFHEVARFQHLALRTERTYWDWVVRYLKFHRDKAGAWQHPKILGSRGVAPFLTWLATERGISASTQNQALNGLLFLYRAVLQLPMVAGDFVRARRNGHGYPFRSGFAGAQRCFHDANLPARHAEAGIGGYEPVGCLRQPARRLERSQKCCSEWNARQPLTRPPVTLSPSDGERDGVRGGRWNVRYMFHATSLINPLSICNHIRRVDRSRRPSSRRNVRRPGCDWCSNKS